MALFMTERTKFPAPGLNGGVAGALGRVEINGSAIDVHKQYVLKKGDRVLLCTPGGGGFGSPTSRNAHESDIDHLLGYV